MEKIPFHIKFIGMLISVENNPYNIALGEIRKIVVFNKPDQPHRFKETVLIAEVINDIPYFTLWAYIAQGYFKMVDAYPIQ